MKAYITLRYIPQITYKLKDVPESNFIVLEAEKKDAKYAPMYTVEELKKELELKQNLKIQEEKEEKRQKKEKEKKEIEAIILSEIEKTVDLIGQENVRNVKIIEDKVIIICEPNANLEALIVRYGAMAFIKKTLNEIVIAIDLNFLLKSRLNVK